MYQNICIKLFFSNPAITTWKPVLSQQEKMEQMLKSIRKAKILQLIALSMLAIGIICSAWLLQVAPNIRRTIPTSKEQVNIITAFLYSLCCAWSGLVLFAYSFYKHRKISKQLKGTSAEG